jgi:hypothetical protein
MVQRVSGAWATNSVIYLFPSNTPAVLTPGMTMSAGIKMTVNSNGWASNNVVQGHYRFSIDQSTRDYGVVYVPSGDLTYNMWSLVTSTNITWWTNISEFQSRFRITSNNVALASTFTNINFGNGITSYVANGNVHVGVSVSGSGSGDAGGTNSRQGGTLALTNLSNTASNNADYVTALAALTNRVDNLDGSSNQWQTLHGPQIAHLSNRVDNLDAVSNLWQTVHGPQIASLSNQISTVANSTNNYVKTIDTRPFTNSGAAVTLSGITSNASSVNAVGQDVDGRLYKIAIGAGSQTPWTSTINGAGNHLTNAGDMTSTGTVTALTFNGSGSGAGSLTLNGVTSGKTTITQASNEKTNTITLGLGAPSDGQVLKYHNSSGTWTNQADNNTGTGGAFNSTSIVVSATNNIILDVGNFDVAKFYLLTNLNQLILSNGSAMAKRAQVYFQQDTNGQRSVTSWAVAGGTLQTNASLVITTNASALDLLEVMPGFFDTNLCVWWPQNFQPRVAFTNSLATGGGGGGGGVCKTDPDISQGNVASPSSVGENNNYYYIGGFYTNGTTATNVCKVAVYVQGIIGDVSSKTISFKIWSLSGTALDAELGSVTVTGHTSTGWKTNSFVTAVALSANTTYALTLTMSETDASNRINTGEGSSGGVGAYASWNVSKAQVYGPTPSTFIGIHLWHETE